MAKTADFAIDASDLGDDVRVLLDELVGGREHMARAQSKDRAT